MAAAAEIGLLLFVRIVLKRHEEFDGRAWLDRAGHNEKRSLGAKIAGTPWEFHVVLFSTHNPAGKSQ